MKVVQLENGAYSVEFEFDDGYTDFAEVGPKETADFYATVGAAPRPDGPRHRNGRTTYVR
jgi:hypothetical protein